MKGALRRSRLKKRSLKGIFYITQKRGESRGGGGAQKREVPAHLVEACKTGRVTWKKSSRVWKCTSKGNADKGLV